MGPSHCPSHLFVAIGCRWLNCDVILSGSWVLCPSTADRRQDERLSPSLAPSRQPRAKHWLSLVWWKLIRTVFSPKMALYISKMWDIYIYIYMSIPKALYSVVNKFLLRYFSSQSAHLRHVTIMYFYMATNIIFHTFYIFTQTLYSEIFWCAMHCWRYVSCVDDM